MPRGFWGRLLGHTTDSTLSGISPHWVLAFLTELHRGQVTRAQIDAALDLDAAESAEFQVIIDDVLGVPGPVLRLARAKEIEEVLVLGGSHFPPYDSIAAVKARLGYA